jgi:hypothetical protein
VHERRGHDAAVSRRVDVVGVGIPAISALGTAFPRLRPTARALELMLPAQLNPDADGAVIIVASSMAADASFRTPG